MSIYINRQIRDYYKNKDLKEALKKVNYHSLLLNKLDRYNKEKNIKSYDLSLLDAIEDSFVNYILTDENSFNNPIVKNYSKLLWSIFLKRPEIVYESKFFHKDIVNKLFTSEQLAKIKEYKIQTTNRIIDELTKTFNIPNGRISNIALRIAEFRIKTGTADNGNLCDKIYNYLLNNRMSNNNMYAKEYIMYYTAYLTSKNLNTPMPYIYISNYTIDNKEFHERDAGVSKGNSGTVVLHYTPLDNDMSLESNLPSIISFMQTTVHEIRHSNQVNEMLKGEISTRAFDYAKSTIFREYLSDKDYDEYKENYFHSEIESDAEVYGWKTVCTIIKKRTSPNSKYIPIFDKNVEKMLCNDLIAMKIEKNKNKLESWEYNVKKMNEIVSQKPQILDKYPQLKLLYSSSGEVKSFFELLQTENSNTNIKDELAKIYNDYYIYYIANNELNKIDPSKLTKSDQLMLFNKLTDLIIDEYQKLTTTIKMYGEYNEINKTEFVTVSVGRTKRIKIILDYLKKYRYLTNKLINSDNQNAQKLSEKLLQIEISIANLEKESLNSEPNGYRMSPAFKNIESLKEEKYEESTKKGR